MENIQAMENTKNITADSSPFLPWIVCFCAALFFFYEFIQGNMFASIADNIMHDFGIKAEKMTYLSSVYYLSNVIFLFFAGTVLDRYSARMTILIAMLVCVLSTFVLAYAESFYLALLCRFVTGIGSAFCFLGPVRLASRWFPTHRMALVTGVIVTIAMTGGMLAQYPLTKLVLQMGWRNAVIQVGWVGLLMFVLMYFGVIDKRLPASDKPREHKKLISCLKQTYTNGQILRAALITSLMNMAIAVFGAMMGSLYLMQRLNIGKEEASFVNMMLFLGSILGGPILGFISDKMRRRVLPMRRCLLVCLLIVCCILYGPVSILSMQILFFLLGFFSAGQIISYALVAENNPPYKIATALSVISVFTQGGYVVYQNLFSWLLAEHGQMHLVNNVPVYSLHDYQFASLILPIGLVVGFFVCLGLKEVPQPRQGR